MDLPHAFAAPLDQALATMAAHPFATLVSGAGADLEATHLPLWHRPAPDGPGSLVGHFARANAQAPDAGAETPVLAIFHGPHAYVSPRWYVTAPAVPTWNYVVVHVHGRLRAVTDAAEAEALMATMGATVEAAGWSFAALAPAYRHRQMAGIVPFTISIDCIAAKAKLSQNRDPADRAAVAAALAASPDRAAQAVAGLMAAADGTQ